MLRNRYKVVSLVTLLGLAALAGCGSGGGDKDEGSTPQALDQEMNAKIASVQNDTNVPAEQKAGMVGQIKQEYADRKAQVAGQK